MQWPKSDHQPSGPLAGIRILDLSAFAVGPWAGALLAALGADVVKIEPTYGDHIRNVRPTKRGEPTTYTVSNMGKRSITLDLKDPDAHRAALSLGSLADVVLENSRAGAMKRLGLDFDAIAAVNPRVVYCSSSSFGSEGPMAPVGSTDPQGQAFSGFVSINGTEGEDPEFLRYSAAVDLSTSSYLVQACLLGLHWRERNGRGCNVTTSQFEGAMAVQVTRSAEFLTTDALPVPLGSGTAAFAPSSAVECRDHRYLALSAATPDEWVRLCRALGRPELLEDERFCTNRERVAHRHELVEIIEGIFREKDLAWWRYLLRGTGVPHAEYANLDDVVSGASNAPVGARLTAVEHPAGGTIRVGSVPWAFSRTPARFSVSPIPGQDQADFITPASEFMQDATSVPIPAVGEEIPPLEGVRVVELAQGISGPYCGWLMACAGAEVLKLEPSSGDFLRHHEPPTPAGSSAAFAAINSGKRSAVLPEGELGRQMLVSLLGAADVVIVGERCGSDAVDDAWIDAHIGAATVLCRTSARGDGVAATELEVQALSGLTRYLGAVMDAPIRMGADLGHVLAGSFLCQGALAALVERSTSGLGQTVETTALGSLAAVGSVMIAAVDGPDEWEGFHCRAAAYSRDGGVKTATGQIAFSSPRRSDEDWRAFCVSVSAGELGDNPVYATDKLRTPRSKELNRDLSRYTREIAREVVLEAAARHGALAVPVQRYDEVFAHPQVNAIDALTATADGHRLAPPWRINGRRPHPTSGVPHLGAHSDALLAMPTS